MILPRLDSLPQELIDQIASEAVIYFDAEEDPFVSIVPDKLADLANLSRTCKRLSVACAPTLFRRVTFQKSDKRLLCFLQSLIRKPYLASYVRVFKAQGGFLYSDEKKVVEGLDKSDPVARRLLQGLREDSSALWGLVTVLALKLLPDVVALITSPLVMQLVTQWPENERLQGTSISTLQIIDGYLRSNDYCKDMFGWRHAFRPGKMPVALRSLRLHHSKCKALSLRDGHIHRRLDNESLDIAASLRRLDLEHWLPECNARDCVARLVELLDKCTSLTHLAFIDDPETEIEAMLGVIVSSTVLTTTLRKLEIRLPWSLQPLNLHTLSQLSMFIRVTSLTLPWIDIEGDAPLESTIWPPALESLTLSVSTASELGPTSFLTLIKAQHFPATMQDITFDWFFRELIDVCEDETESEDVRWIVELIYFSQELDEEFASSGIVLLHKHCSLDNLQSCSDSSSSSISTNFEGNFLVPLLRSRISRGYDELDEEEQSLVDEILDEPSHPS